MSNLIEKQCTLLIPFDTSVEERKESTLMVRKRRTTHKNALKS